MPLKPLQELLFLKYHAFYFIAVRIVFVAEADSSIFNSLYPVAGNSCLVCVPAQILQYLIRPTKRCFGIHFPLLIARFPDGRIYLVITGCNILLSFPWPGAGILLCTYSAMLPWEIKTCHWPFWPLPIGHCRPHRHLPHNAGAHGNRAFGPKCAAQR